MHALSYRLHPSVIEDLGLVEALRAECDRVTRSGAVTVQFNASEIPRKLPRIRRCACSVLHRRHCATSSDTPERPPSMFPSRRMDGGLQLAVSDNGTGFDPDRHAERPSLGLASIRERVNLLKGQVDIDSAQGHGTTVLAWVPFPVSST